MGAPSGQQAWLSCVSLVQESACMKALAAGSMWDLCTEKGSGDLDQFQKVNRLISDQLFSSFVSEAVPL